MIETIDSEKLADALNAAAEKKSSLLNLPLRVLVQVNTSGDPGN